MTSRRITKRLVGAGALTLAVGLSGAVVAAGASTPVTIATGLNSPRQLTFTPGGDLYVAEAGTGGTSNCQDHPEFGHVCLGMTGSVAHIGRDGTVNRVVTGLPSAGSASDASGPSDIVFSDNHRFALAIGLGGSDTYKAGYGRAGDLLGTVVTGELWGNKRINRVHKAFNVVRYEKQYNPDGTDIDSNPVGLTATGNGWVVADAGGNSVISTRKGGSTVAVLPPVPTTQPGPVPVGTPADAVPTDVVKGPDGAWYVSQLVGFPFEKGSASIWRVTPGHAPVKWATNLTNVTSLAFGSDGSLYAVQLASNGLLSGPFGSLVKVTPHGTSHETVADGLFAPYGVAIHRGMAYVTTGSVLPGGGAVVRVAL